MSKSRKNQQPKQTKFLEEEEDPNKKWGHAQSLEETRLWEDRKAELQYMKDLFDVNLPTGEKKEAITTIFNQLEEAIDNKDQHIQNDKFNDDFGSIDIDGAVASPPKQYKYFSADLFKQQAANGQGRLHAASQGELEYKPSSQAMETSTNVDEEQSVQYHSEDDGDLQHMDVRSDDFDPNYWVDGEHSEW
jgi:hypothetical protein